MATRLPALLWNSFGVLWNASWVFVQIVHINAGEQLAYRPWLLAFFAGALGLHLALIGVIASD